jgi:PAS domain S-box-containing protein
MSKKRKAIRPPRPTRGSRPRGTGACEPDGPSPVPRDAAFWTPFERYNDLPAPQRAAALEGLGIHTTDREVLSILTKSHFVIPGKTRHECRQCGECCRYARKVAQLTYEPCPFLTPENRCAKHDQRYLVCKWFPFWIYNDPRLGELLTIKPFCSGFGQGPVVPYEATLARIRKLAAARPDEVDGAFVIHEVLYIPGRRDWSFPSKANVDALMAHIQREAQRASQPRPAARPLERIGEVHYAHHYTSGLLGSIHDPLLTVDPQGAVTDANEALCQLLARERDQIIETPLATFFVNPERVNAAIKSCFSKGKETASPQRLRLPDESAIAVLLNGLAFRDRSDGLVHSLLWCINPVSASVFQEVSQSRDYARGLLEASLDALFVIDRDGAITDVNEAAADISGRTREELLGSPFRLLFADPIKAQRGVDIAFRDDKVRNYDLTVVNREQEPIPVSFNAGVYRDSDGVVQGVFAAARDIRERLAMIRQLEEARSSTARST